MTEVIGTTLGDRGIDRNRDISERERELLINQLGLTEEKIQELLKQEFFQKDLLIISQNPNNQTELSNFIVKYNIQKPVSKEVSVGDIPRKIDGTIDFDVWFAGKTADEIRRMSKRLTKRTDKEDYDDYLDKQVLKGKELDAKLIKIEEWLKSSKEALDKILSAGGKKELNGEIAKIKNNPDSPEYKELIAKGAKPADIVGGKYDTNIIASYTLTHATEFVAKGWISKGNEAQFQVVLQNFASALEKNYTIPKSIGVTKFLESTLINGERKERVLGGVKDIASTKSYDMEQATYNSKTGYITFPDKTSTNYARINTGKNPPIIEYGKNTLTISREIEGTQKSPEVIKRENVLGEMRKEFTEKKRQTLGGILQNYSKFSDEGKGEALGFLDTLDKIHFDDITDPAKRKKAILVLENEKIRVGNLRFDASQGAELQNQQETAKKEIQNKLGELIENCKELGKKHDALPPLPQENKNLFDSQARSTLNYLTYIGYDELGQGAFDKIVGALNRENQGKIGEINLSKNPKLDTAQEKELLRVLARITRRSPLMGAWKGVDPTDEMIAGRQMGSPNWRTSLQDVRTSQNFIDALQGSADRLRTYIYEDISKKDTVPDFSAINEQAPQTFQA